MPLVQFTGDLSIREAVETKARILAALAEGGGELSIDCRQAERVDLSFIQLLFAARKAGVDAGCSVRLAAAASGALLATLERGGFLDEEPADSFWTMGTRQQGEAS